MNKNSNLRPAFISWLLGWISGAFRVLVFMKGWDWFVTPAFDIPNPGFYPLWGIMLLISFTTFHYQPSKDEDQIPIRPGFLFMYSLTHSALYWVSFIIVSQFI